MYSSILNHYHFLFLYVVIQTTYCKEVPKHPFLIQTRTYLSMLGRPVNFLNGPALANSLAFHSGTRFNSKFIFGTLATGRPCNSWLVLSKSQSCLTYVTRRHISYFFAERDRRGSWQGSMLSGRKSSASAARTKISSRRVVLPPYHCVYRLNYLL